MQLRNGIRRVYLGLSMGMGFPWEYHGKCLMGRDGMGQHALHFLWAGAPAGGGRGVHLPPPWKFKRQVFFMFKFAK